jgi:hypothetical protein
VGDAIFRPPERLPTLDEASRRRDGRRLGRQAVLALVGHAGDRSPGAGWSRPIIGRSPDRGKCDAKPV